LREQVIKICGKAKVAANMQGAKDRMIKFQKIFGKEVASEMMEFIAWIERLQKCFQENSCDKEVENLRTYATDILKPIVGTQKEN
jgi:hypothetical protein